MNYEHRADDSFYYDGLLVTALERPAGEARVVVEIAQENFRYLPLEQIRRLRDWLDHLLHTTDRALPGREPRPP